MAIDDQCRAVGCGDGVDLGIVYSVRDFVAVIVSSSRVQKRLFPLPQMELPLTLRDFGMHVGHITRSIGGVDQDVLFGRF